MASGEKGQSFPSFPDSVWERPCQRDSVALPPFLVPLPLFPDSVASALPHSAPSPRDRMGSTLDT